MAGTPKMQEHFLTAMDGRNAEIAGANFGRRVPASQVSGKMKCKKRTRSFFLPDPASFERQNRPQLSAIPSANLLTSAGTR